MAGPCPFVLGSFFCRQRHLLFVLIEIKRGVELRRAGEQFLKPWEVVNIPLGGSKELQEAQPFAP